MPTKIFAALLILALLAGCSVFQEEGQNGSMESSSESVNSPPIPPIGFSHSGSGLEGNAVAWPEGMSQR